MSRAVRPTRMEKAGGIPLGSLNQPWLQKRQVRNLWTSSWACRWQDPYLLMPCAFSATTLSSEGFGAQLLTLPFRRGNPVDTTSA
eukprot:4927126-Lingulodinium_polyedra.AAC.1